MDSVNWIAVLAGAIAGFLFGWAVYSPGVFGRKWAEGSGVDLGSAASMPVFAMAAQFAALLALATVIGLTAASDALWTAMVAIVAAALFTVSGGAFVRKTGYALAVDGGYVLGAGALMIAAQGLL